MKLIDLRDSTGSGDVDISTIVKITNQNEEFIQGLSGRKLKVKLKKEFFYFEKCENFYQKDSINMEKSVWKLSY